MVGRPTTTPGRYELPLKPFEVMPPNKVAQYVAADFVDVVCGCFRARFRPRAVSREYDMSCFPGENHTVDTHQWDSAWKYSGYIEYLRTLGEGKVQVPDEMKTNRNGTDNDTLTIGWSGGYVCVVLEQVGDVRFDTTGNGAQKIPHKLQKLTPRHALVQYIVDKAGIFRSSHATAAGTKTTKDNHFGVHFNYSFDSRGKNTQRE